MKKKIILEFILLMLMGISIILLNTCKKEEDYPCIDGDGNQYNIVTIGTQVWMAENLKTTKYNDDTDIALVTDSIVWINLTTPGYCWYNNDISNKSTYGALYNWYTANTGKLCPKGWHVPSDNEWTTLTDFLGGESIAGGKLKEAGTLHWISPNTGATNESGFTALPGGFRGALGTCYFIGTWGNYWTSTSPFESVAYYRVMTSDSQGVDNGKSNAVQRLIGHSVRCLRN